MNYINVNQLAKSLGISKDLAYRMVHTTGFPSAVLGNRRIVVDADKVPEWLENNAPHPSAINPNN